VFLPSLNASVRKGNAGGESQRRFRLPTLARSPGWHGRYWTSPQAPL